MKNKFLINIKIIQLNGFFYSKKTNLGFTVLFAVIVSSLILALGLGIVAITMKEVKLSGAGRDSQLAFYAADSGSECAEYYDIVKSAFATSSESTGNIPIICNKQTLVRGGSSDLVSATTTFTMCMEYNPGGLCKDTKPCADVTVSKNTSTTIIDARGYNTCDKNNPRRLERGYRVRYNNSND